MWVWVTSFINESVCLGPRQACVYSSLIGRGCRPCQYLLPGLLMITKYRGSLAPNTNIKPHHASRKKRILEDYSLVFIVLLWCRTPSLKGSGFHPQYLLLKDLSLYCLTVCSLMTRLCTVCREELRQYRDRSLRSRQGLDSIETGH